LILQVLKIRDNTKNGLKCVSVLCYLFYFGGGDEKKNRFFAFDLDGNNNLVHPLSSGWEGGFSISTGMSIL
jgi:hypothetical protein